MKKTRILLTVFIVCCILCKNCFASYAKQSPEACITVSAHGTSAVRPMANGLADNIAPCSADTEWQYKLINGQLYRRLYNLRTHSWIGDWELVP